MGFRPNPISSNVRMIPPCSPEKRSASPRVLKAMRLGRHRSYSSTRQQVGAARCSFGALQCSKSLPSTKSAACASTSSPVAKSRASSRATARPRASATACEAHRGQQVRCSLPSAYSTLNASAVQSSRPHTSHDAVVALQAQHIARTASRRTARSGNLERMMHQSIPRRPRDPPRGRSGFAPSSIGRPPRSFELLDGQVDDVPIGV